MSISLRAKLLTLSVAATFGLFVSSPIGAQTEPQDAQQREAALQARFASQTPGGYISIGERSIPFADYQKARETLNSPDGKSFVELLDAVKIMSVVPFAERVKAPALVEKVVLMPDATEEGIVEALNALEEYEQKLRTSGNVEDAQTVANRDATLERLINAHSESWRVQFAALRAMSVPKSSYSDIIDERFEAQSARERDRVRRLRVLRDAETLVRAESQQEGENAATDEVKSRREERVKFYEYFIDVLCADCYRALLELSDLNAQPEPRSEQQTAQTPQIDVDLNALFDSRPKRAPKIVRSSLQDQITSSRNGVPIDEQGTPIFFKSPNSFEEAQSDGERLMALFDSLERVGGDEGRLAALRARAGFAWSTFGVFFLAEVGLDQERVLPLADSYSDPWKLASLKDDETLAYLSTGPKRLTLPQEYDFIAMWNEILKLDPNDLTTYDYLAAEYQARRQTDRLAPIQERERALFEPTLRASGGTKGTYGVSSLNNVNFSPSSPNVSGLNATLLLNYVTASEATIVVKKLNVKAFLEQIRDPEYRFNKFFTVNSRFNDLIQLDRESPEVKQKKELQASQLEEEAKKLPEMRAAVDQFKMQTPDPLPNDKTFIGEEVARFNVKLPAKSGLFIHETAVDLPIHEPGVYLVEATTSEGKGDETLVKLNSDAILRYMGDEGVTYTVVDAVTGEPKPNVLVELLDVKLKRSDPKKAPVFPAPEKTDASGSVFFKLHTPDQPDYLNYITVASESDESDDAIVFTDVESFSNVKNAVVMEVPEQTLYCVMSQPTYRPGQKVNFRTWHKDPEGVKAYYAEHPEKERAKKPFGVFKITVVDPAHKGIFTQTTEADENGAVSSSFELPEDALEGRYHVTVQQTDDGSKDEIARDSFDVKNYAERGQATIDMPEKPVLVGEPFEATVSARDVQGKPLAGARVVYRLLWSGRDPSKSFMENDMDKLFGEGYAQLAYPDPVEPQTGLPKPGRGLYNYSGKWGPNVLLTNAGTLDDQGKLKLRFETTEPLRLNPDRDQLYILYAEIQDGENVVLAANSIDVVKRPFRTAIQFERGFYAEDEPMNATIQARRPDGTPIVGIANVTLFRETYDADAKVTETEVVAKSLKLDAAGRASVEFGAQPSGQYRLACVVETSDGQREEDAQLILVCDKNGELAPNSARFNGLEIVPDKSEYKVGDVARFLIASSRPDAFVYVRLRQKPGALVEPQTIQLKNGIGFVETTIEPTDAANFFVRATTCFDGQAYEEQREAFVLPQDMLFNVAIDSAPEVARSGEKLRFDLSLTDLDGKPVAGRVLVAAYDAALGELACENLRGLYCEFGNAARYPQTTLQFFAPDKLRDKFDVTRDRRVASFNFGTLYARLPLLSDFRKEKTAVSRGLIGITPAYIMPKSRSSSYGAINFGADDMSQFAFQKMSGSFGVTLSGDKLRLQESQYAALAAASTRVENVDLAYWAPDLTVDASGKLSVEFDAPQNGSTWKFVALAFDENGRVGVASTTFVTEPAK